MLTKVFLVEQPPMQWPNPNVWQRWGQVGIGRRCTGRSALSRRSGRCTPGGDVSLFVYDSIEFDKYCIRQQDPNIYSDTEARCLV